MPIREINPNSGELLLSWLSFHAGTIRYKLVSLNCPTGLRIHNPFGLVDLASLWRGFPQDRNPINCFADLSRREYRAAPGNGHGFVSNSAPHYRVQRREKDGSANHPDGDVRDICLLPDKRFPLLGHRRLD
jgi:hypothetical protein